MENNVFTINWWKESLQINENNSDQDIIEKIIKGFELVPFKGGFGNSYTTKNKKATLALTKRIYKWTKDNFPNNNIIIRFEKTFGTINLEVASDLKEKQYQNVDDAFEQIVNANRDKLEKTAAVFNVPIPDVLYAFTAGNIVVLSDDIWEKLENSKSFGFTGKVSKVEDGLPLILNYDKDKYYLVTGDSLLAAYKQLNKVPKVLMATLNLGTGKQVTLQEYSDKLNESQTATIGEFIKYTCKNLKIQKPPRTLTLSYNNDEVKDKRSFGYFDPNNSKIWVYVRNRNMADILRTLAHELVHHKQNEDERISYESGKTGSDIENEANAKAGILLRDFGKQRNDIYQ